MEFLDLSICVDYDDRLREIPQVKVLKRSNGRGAQELRTGIVLIDIVEAVADFEHFVETGHLDGAHDLMTDTDQNDATFFKLEAVGELHQRAQCHTGREFDVAQIQHNGNTDTLSRGHLHVVQQGARRCVVKRALENLHDQIVIVRLNFGYSVARHAGNPLGYRFDRIIRMPVRCRQPEISSTIHNSVLGNLDASGSTV